MTAEPAAPAPPAVDAEARLKLLRNLSNRRSFQASRLAAGLDEATARRVAGEAGWPDWRRVHETWIRDLRETTAREVPVEDHPAVTRALELAQALRARTPAAVAAVTSGWSAVEVLEVACAAAAMIPADVVPSVALAWLDLPPGEWPALVLAVEVGRWDAGARDRTASDAHEERQRREMTS